MQQGEFDEAKLELTTLLDIIRFGMSAFNKAGCYYGHGTDNAWDEALSLALHALALDESVKAQVLNATLLSSEKQAILTLYQRRIKERIPAAYLRNKAAFAGLDFYVDERVLVPRSPLAELIEERFVPWIEPDDVEHILDLCTGSGCIAIASALAFEDAQVDAIDISKDALAVAKINQDHYQLHERLQLIESNLFEALTAQQYDIIVSNPPYVDAHDIQTMPKEYHQEPMLGLAAGEDGLLIVDTLLKNAAKHLTDKGILVVEVGNSAYALQEKYPDVAFTWLDFERGGEGVFILTKGQLKAFS